MRFDVITAALMTEVFAIEPNFANMVAKGLSGQAIEYDEKPVNSVAYQKIGNIAVIDVDGVMYKKDLSGACVSVASYQEIIKYHKQAEADAGVDKIVYHVSTPGGDVGGADRLRSLIEKSSKPVEVFADDILASAGMWIFSAADKIYASPTTVIGSIGIIVGYEDKETNMKYIVSSNAPNKWCDVKDEACKSKIQSRLDEYEAIFYDRLVSSFGKDKEKIKEDFDNGGTILAEVAFKLGYIDGVMHFDEYLPPAQSVNPKGGNGTTKFKGVSMDEKQIEALQTELAYAKEQIASLTAELGGLKESMKAQEEVAKTAIKLGLEMGVSKDTILAAMEADNAMATENIILKEKATASAVVQGAPKSEQKENPYSKRSQKMKGVIR